jgi:hypothetical protein
MIGVANRRSDSNETPTLANGFTRFKYRFPLSLDATRARKLQVTQVLLDEPHLEPAARSTVSGRWGEREFDARIPVCTGRRCAFILVNSDGLRGIRNSLAQNSLWLQRPATIRIV